MKKATKLIALLLSLCMVFALAACGDSKNNPAPAVTSSPSGAQQGNETEAPSDGETVEPITLKLAHNTAATGMTGEQYQAFADLVSEESGGAMQVEIFASGSLVTDVDALDAVMEGQCDFAHGMVSYMDGLIKDIVPLEIPGYYIGEDFVKFSETIQPIMEDIFADYNVKFLGSNYQGQAGFVSVDRLITKPEDLKGMAVRAAGTYISKAVEAWGGAPTTVSLPDLTTALERKSVDAAYTGYSIIGSFKLYEMAKKVTFTTITESYAGLIMSMDTWNKLSPAQQAVIERAAERWRTETFNVGDAYRQQYIDEINAAGIDVYEMSPDETKAFTDLSSALFDDVEPGLGEKGKQLLETLRELNG